MQESKQRLSRRELLKRSAAGSVALAVTSAGCCAAAPGGFKNPGTARFYGPDGAFDAKAAPGPTTR